LISEVPKKLIDKYDAATIRHIKIPGNISAVAYEVLHWIADSVEKEGKIFTMVSSQEQKKIRLPFNEYDSSKEYPEGTVFYWEDNDEEEDVITTEEIEALIKEILQEQED